MKTASRATLVIVVLSFSVVFLSGCLSPRNAPLTHDDIFLNLNEEVNILLPLAKDSLAKGEDFKVMVNGVEVYGSNWIKSYLGADPLNERRYWLNGKTKPLYEGLTGLLTLH